MGVNASELVAYCEGAYQEKGGYIWGQSGDLWTEAKQAALEKTTDANRANSRKHGKKWIGHHVWDCSGLPYRGLKKLGINISHGCNPIWRSKTQLSLKGKITSGMKLPAGALIFTGTENEHPHMGVLVTSTCVCEAKGAENGVVHTPLSNKKWTYWGLVAGLDYEFIPGSEASNANSETLGTATGSTTKPTKNHHTLRKSYRGSDVKYLQELLLKAGEKLPKYGADGQFGNETVRAVQSFQRKNGLEIDGIVGKQTWAALAKYEEA